MSTLTQWINKSQERKRAYAQERLIVDVTEAIYERLAAAGLTKADLARELPSSRSHISQLLSGGRNMTLRTLADMGHILGCKVTVTLEVPTRACTCHPDDNPPRSCPQKFALTECRAASSQGEIDGR
jgi:transcriptional regulator with XRE-family HTH domain